MHVSQDARLISGPDDVLLDKQTSNLLQNTLQNAVSRSLQTYFLHTPIAVLTQSGRFVGMLIDVTDYEITLLERGSVRHLPLCTILSMACHCSSSYTANQARAARLR